MPASKIRFAKGFAAFSAAALLVISGLLAFRELDRMDAPAKLSLAVVTSEIQPLTGTLPATMDFAATYDGVFQTTVYYTPREDGFFQSAGFDMALETRAGLQGTQFPRDFLKAVATEGFGRMKKAVSGKQYLFCCRGQWGFADVPVDSVGQPLKARQSCAVGAGYQLIQPKAKFRVRAAGLPSALLDAQWLVCDTGSGLKPRQIDLYWGEDAPLGPGPRLARPRGLPDHIENPTILVLR